MNTLFHQRRVRILFTINDCEVTPFGPGYTGARLNMLHRGKYLKSTDDNVYRAAERFSSTVLRKDTFSGVYTNFRSFIPGRYKRGLLSTLLYRGFMTFSSYSSLYEEVEKLKMIFSKNGHPQKFVNNCICEIFNKIYEQLVQIPIVSKRWFTMVLPFL